jgi:hypothetical protein
MNYEPWILTCALPALLIGRIYVLGRKLSEPEKMMRAIPGGLTPEQTQFILQYKDWLASQNLEFNTAFQFGAIRAAVFQEKGLPRYFSFQFHQRLTFSAESYLEDLTILDTSNSGALGLFPRPGAYAQSFPNISAQDLWRLHLEGEAHLTKKFGCQWKPINRSYYDLVVEAMRVRMKYNRSQFLWPVRVLYRFFVTRHRIANRSIVEQFP